MDTVVPELVPSLLTIDEYKKRVDAISKLDKAVEMLRTSEDQALVSAGEHMFSVLQKLGDSLALGLAAYARACEGHKETKTSGASVGYYIDDVWQALGRYAYHADDGSGVEPLCSLRYALEKIAAALAPPAAPEPSAEAESEAERVYREALADGLSDHEARETAWPPLHAKPAPAYDGAIGDDNETVISEYEREQEPQPDPGPIRN